MNSIELKIVAQTAIITLNKEQKHNSLNKEDVALFREKLKEIKSNTNLRSLIITGNGKRTFCAGASFEHVKDGTLTGEAFSELAADIQNLAIPSICVANGSIFGGGVELALACDFRIGLYKTALKVPVAKLGICYSAFGLNLYTQKLGSQLSKRMLLCAEEFTAKELLQLGFYDHLHEQYKNAFANAQELAQDINALAPLAVQNMRATLNEINQGCFNLQTAQEREQICLKSQDKLEGFAAILEKRDAQFQNQ